MTLFVAAMLPVLVSLGLWQLDRGAEKRTMESDYLAKLTELPREPGLEARFADFQRLRLKGSFTDEVFLVDNQIHDGRVGYWVMQGFETLDRRKFVLNRGFLGASQDRAVLPFVPTPQQELVVIGMVWPFTGLVPVLDDDAWGQGWPKRVQRADIKRMAEFIGAADVEIRLEAGAGTLVPAPFAARLSDDIHRGYAATWFGLAIALVILYIIYGFKSED